MATERRIRLGNQLVPYDDATEEVNLDRIASDIAKAKPGDAMKCMNAQCIKAQRNWQLFPHSVYAASVIPSMAYIVDEIELNGDRVVFKHAVRYQLTQKESKLIRNHDTFGVGEAGLLRLRIPRDPKGSPKRAASAAKNGGGGRYADGAGHGSNPGEQSTGKRNRHVTGNAGRAADHRVVVAALNLTRSNKIVPPGIAARPLSKTAQ